MDDKDFIHIKKLGRGAHELMPDKTLLLTEKGIRVRRSLLMGLANGQKFIKIDYSPRHEALRLTAEADGSIGFTPFQNSYASTSILVFTMPRSLKNLKPERGYYVQVPGSNNIFKLDRNMK